MADKVELKEDGRYYPPKKMSETTYIHSMAQYKEMYERSLKDPEGFWGEIASQFYWKEKLTWLI